jgi:hypothetical protein
MPLALKGGRCSRDQTVLTSYDSFPIRVNQGSQCGGVWAVSCLLCSGSGKALQVLLGLGLSEGAGAFGGPVQS